MPWKIFKEGGEFCVYKHDADGNKVGDALGCHPSRAARNGMITDGGLDEQRGAAPPKAKKE